MGNKRTPLSTSKPAETCVLIGLATRHQRRGSSKNIWKNWLFWWKRRKRKRSAYSSKALTNRMSGTFVGSGKLQEIKDFVEEEDIDMIVFDDELSPIQLRNIEKEIPERKILDRTNLILDIFAQRAATAHAKTQVELAQYQYLLPRLTNMWTHLQKQKGGIGMKGPGEKEIETDRRVIRDRIAFLRNSLKASTSKWRHSGRIEER